MNVRSLNDIQYLNIRSGVEPSSGQALLLTPTQNFLIFELKSRRPCLGCILYQTFYILYPTPLRLHIRCLTASCGIFNVGVFPYILYILKGFLKNKNFGIFRLNLGSREKYYIFVKKCLTNWDLYVIVVTKM